MSIVGLFLTDDDNRPTDVLSLLTVLYKVQETVPNIVNISL